MIQRGSFKVIRDCLVSDILYKFIFRAVALVNHVIAFRILGLKAFGQLAFFDTVSAFGTLIIDAGFNEVIFRWVPKYKSAPEGDARSTP